MAACRAHPAQPPRKAAIVCAGVAPDLDGLGLIPELLTRNSSHPLLWFSQYHHALHTLAFVLVVSAAAWLCSSASFPQWLSGPFGFGSRTQKPAAVSQPCSSRPLATALLAFLSFHLHLFCDLIGSRGPDGYSWPIPYLSPFSNTLQLTWHHQ